MENRRNDPEFRPELFPSSQNEPTPRADDPDPVARRKLALLAAYYRINVAYQELLKLRESPEHTPDQERSAVQQLEKTLLTKDSLEDECAIHGIASSPHLENGVITEVAFTFPGSAAAPWCMSTYVAVTPPQG